MKLFLLSKGEIRAPLWGGKGGLRAFSLSFSGCFLAILLALFSLLPVASEASAANDGHGGVCVLGELFNVFETGAEEMALTMQNDGFIPVGGSDEGFSQGLWFSWRCFGARYFYDNEGKALYYDDFSSSGQQTGPVRYKTSVAFRMGQLIFTPANLAAKEALYDDRPYAGWFFIGGEYETVTSENRSERIGLSIGCVGPCAAAESSQLFFHRIAPDSAIPQGWDNQIGYEPGIVADYQRRSTLRFAGFDRAYGPPLGWDLVDIFTARFGNIFNDLEYGLLFRAGGIEPLFDSPWFAGPDVKMIGAPKKVVDALTRKAHQERWRNDLLPPPLEWFFYLEGKGRLVLYDATLQGGMFTDSQVHTAAPEPLVAEGVAGFAVVFIRARLDVAVGGASPTFSTEEGGTGPWSWYGRITLAYRF